MIAIIAATALFASIIGAVIGIGGGVIIKPVLDMMGVMSVAEASFLSGATVLCMSAYSVIKNSVSKTQTLDMKTALALSLGAAAGGIAGKQIFSYISGLFTNSDTVGAVQAAALFALTALTLVYTLKTDNIKTRHIKNGAVSAAGGLFLGICSSFLGIGGGPINIMILSYLFSFDAKTTAMYSLFIIMVSQIASIVLQVVTASVPPFSPAVLAVMAVCAVLGGIIGRFINSKIDNKRVDKLFIVMIALIMCICAYNFCRFAL
ncbi:MAG: sulfite exporter TauE/SafE family protein [Firmicutes bacterium]|nr:sulfite exporter TauE/SafE family protein [Bacillota bacterium]